LAEIGAKVRLGIAGWHNRIVFHGVFLLLALATLTLAVTLLREEPTAVVCSSDMLALVACEAARSLGLRVPDDLSVVGIFSEDFGRMFSLPYTAVESSPDKLGRSAVQSLVRRMLDPEGVGAFETSLIAPTLTDRGSTR